MLGSLAVDEYLRMSRAMKGLKGLRDLVERDDVAHDDLRIHGAPGQRGQAGFELSKIVSQTEV